MWKLLSQWHFQLRNKLRPKVCAKSILDNFDEAVLRIAHNFYLADKTTTNSEGNTQENVRIHWLRRTCNLTETGAEKNRI